MDYLPASEAATTQEEREVRECRASFMGIQEIRYLKMVSVWNELEYGIYRIIMFVIRAAKWSAEFVKKKMGR